MRTSLVGEKKGDAPDETVFRAHSDHDPVVARAPDDRPERILFSVTAHLAGTQTLTGIRLAEHHPLEYVSGREGCMRRRSIITGN